MLENSIENIMETMDECYRSIHDGQSKTDKEKEFDAEILTILYHLRKLQKEYIDNLDEDYCPKECHKPLADMLIAFKELINFVTLKNAIKYPHATEDDYFNHDAEWFENSESKQVTKQESL